MKITICIGSSCHLKGSRLIVEGMQALVREHGLEGDVELSGRFCMGGCQNGVCLTVDGRKFSLKPDDVGAFFESEVLKRV
ncbi:MAG: (2Fe-2S) ferredoxin domain-containing protein [Clostridiales bacterium]|nr:(2Fe-2S) ferredoxin domain-containing protein [Clostridiales bacterium]